ncbi:MAG: hypothetical protein ACFFG0_02685 [Candidatus Thorarchaeota archaeon]
MIIKLKEATCKHCGSGRKVINIKYFNKDFIFITTTILKIWGKDNKKKCYRCHKKPKLGETWGVSINYNEKNRIFCSECSLFIDKKLKENEK